LLAVQFNHTYIHTPRRNSERLLQCMCLVHIFVVQTVIFSCWCHQEMGQSQNAVLAWI